MVGTIALHMPAAAPPEDRPASTLLVSVITPTFNEAANLPILVERLHEALGDVSHEIVVADDDSPDRTWEVAERIAEHDP